MRGRRQPYLRSPPSSSPGQAGQHSHPAGVGRALVRAARFRAWRRGISGRNEDRRLKSSQTLLQRSSRASDHGHRRSASGPISSAGNRRGGSVSRLVQSGSRYGNYCPPRMFLHVCAKQLLRATRLATRPSGSRPRSGPYKTRSEATLCGPALAEAGGARHLPGCVPQRWAATRAAYCELARGSG
jgi:hypothetical protein